MESIREQVFKQCQNLFPEWQTLSIDDFTLDDPKGFSSFTMGVRCKKAVQPTAVLYRRLEGKENAILDFSAEKELFLTLGEHKIAAHCYYYDETCRIEAFYEGNTLSAEELFDVENLRKIAGELARFHQIKPTNLPQKTFFELLHEQWGAQARIVLEEKQGVFPPNEQILCENLREIYSEETLAKVKRCLPDEPLTFCHNDTYHGNIMKLDNGDIKLLDFEFSCLNHKAYDFSNLFAETVMKHKQPDYPYFYIAEPEFGTHEIAKLANFYLNHFEFDTREEREQELQTLVQEIENMLMMSDYVYAMAALPLAIEPIQKIRFIPYSYARFSKFLNAYDRRFGTVAN